MNFIFFMFVGSCASDTIFFQPPAGIEDGFENRKFGRKPEACQKGRVNFKNITADPDSYRGPPNGLIKK